MIKKPVAVPTALLALFVALIVFTANRPDSFSVQREITINAPPEKVIGLIHDFHNWSAWSPWEQRDPAMKRSYLGAPRGKGAAYLWSGNEQVGTTRVEIVRSSATSYVDMEVDVIAPVPRYNTAEFTLEPQGGSTKVVWTMRGALPFSAKLKEMFLSTDSLLGKDFETGLRNIKTLAERPAQTAPAT